MIDLRYYQNDVLRKIITSVNDGDTSILGVLPCRSGKTPLAAKIIDILYKKNKRVLFNVHRSVLVDQTHNLLTYHGIEHGIISPYYPATDHNVQIGSIMTVYKRRNSIKPFDCIISDEAHRDQGNTRKLLTQLWKKSLWIGFTATPRRLDNKPLSDIYKKLIVGASPNELINNKFLCDYVVYSPPCLIDQSGLSTGSNGDFKEKELEKATDKNHITGDAIKHYLNKAFDTQMSVYACSIEHAKHITHEYRQAGINTATLHSLLSNVDCKNIVNSFVSKDIKIIVNVDMLTEGFDCPGIETVQLLRKTMSLALHIQMSTRGMTIDRNNPDKKAIILDHVDNTNNHGFVDDDFNWEGEYYLSSDEIKDKKLSLLIADTYTPKGKMCERCYHFYPIHFLECPECGHTKFRQFIPPKIIDKELLEIKSTNKKIRELIGNNEVMKVSIDELKNRLQLLINNNISVNHNEFIKIEKRISLLRAKSLPEIINHAKKYNYDKLWVVKRFSYLNRGIGSIKTAYKYVNSYLQQLGIDY